MSPFWYVAIGLLWALVLLETGFVLLLLRGLGKLRLQLDQLEQNFFSHPTTSPNLGGLPAGQRIPDFEALDAEGHVIGLNNLSGKRSIIAFVSPGCAACLGAIEALNQFVADGGDYQVLVVGGQNASLNRSYAKEHNASMPILTPLSSAIEEQFNVHAHPFVFVVDEDAVVLATGVINGKEHFDRLLMSVGELVHG